MDGPYRGYHIDGRIFIVEYKKVAIISLGSVEKVEGTSLGGIIKVEGT